MAFGKFKKMFNSDDDLGEEEYYVGGTEETVKKSTDSGNSMILVEPRAYSESQQIADHLKNKNAVVVNFKRVTSEQSKRILDFLTGTLYAIGGAMEKLGNGIYLCTPKNVTVQGKMTTEEEGNKKSKNEEEQEW
jgi:cell division inhibitor SepF